MRRSRSGACRGVQPVSCSRYNDAVDRLQLLSLKVAAVLGTVMAVPAHARCHIEGVAALPLEADVTQPLTQGLIDGRPVRVLIDTGSALSFIWRPAAERLGLRLRGIPRIRLFGLGGESQVDATYIGELQVQALSLKSLRLPVAGDLPNRADVIFGEDFLAHHSMEFDVRHGVVRIVDTSGCSPAELPYWSRTYSMADLLASPLDARAVRVNVLLNGHVVRAQVDSGSSATLLDKSVADSAGVRYSDSRGAVVGIGQRALRIWIADVRSFKLGDESIANTQLRVAQLSKYQTMDRIGSRIPAPTGTGPALLLGMDFLRSHRVFIDNTTRKMVFTYEGGPVFEIDRPAMPEAPASDTVRSVSKRD